MALSPSFILMFLASLFFPINSRIFSVNSLKWTLSSDCHFWPFAWNYYFFPLFAHSLYQAIMVLLTGNRAIFAIPSYFHFIKNILSLPWLASALWSHVRNPLPLSKHVSCLIHSHLQHVTYEVCPTLARTSLYVCFTPSCYTSHVKHALILSENLLWLSQHNCLSKYVLCLSQHHRLS